MLDPDRRKSYGVTSALLAWFILVTYVAGYVTSASFKVLLSGGEPINDYDPGLHVSFGLAAFILVVLRLLWWIKNQPPMAPKKMSEAAYSLSRLTLLLMYLNVLQLTVCGFLSAWAMGVGSSVFALLALPVLAEETTAWMVQAHAISLLVNYAVLALYVLVNGFLAIRYKAGFRRMLPGVHV